MLKRTLSSLAPVIAVVAFLLVACSRGNGSTKATTVRIGWQTAWATQGQVVQAMRTTDILDRNGILGEFTGFPAGPPAIEAALAGALDVVSGGSQPIIQLLSRSDEWVIVGRHANVRLGVLVPPSSEIEDLRSLAGKKIGLPIGSTAERFVLLLAEAENIPLNEIELMNIGIEELGEFVGRGEPWGDIAAVAAWEPTVSLIEQADLGRVVAEENEITLTAMSKAFITEQPEAAVGYMRATLEAWHHYATHRDELNRSYLQESRLALEHGLLEGIAGNEPNAAVTRVENVDIAINDDLQARLQRSADFLLERQILTRPVRIAAVTNQELLARARVDL